MVTPSLRGDSTKAFNISGVDTLQARQPSTLSDKHMQKASSCLVKGGLCYQHPTPASMVGQENDVDKDEHIGDANLWRHYELAKPKTLDARYI